MRKSLAFFVKKIVKAGEFFFLNGRCKDAVFFANMLQYKIFFCQVNYIAVA